jgi:hypothetical protein
MSETVDPAEAAVQAIASAGTWDERVSLIRKIPEHFGKAQHAGIYAAVASAVYVPHLAPDFAFIDWPDEYELKPVADAYVLAKALTGGFKSVTPDALAGALLKAPTTLQVFRLLLGFTTQEFAASTAIIAERTGAKPMTNSTVKSVEGGRAPRGDEAALAAAVVDETMRGVLFGPHAGEGRPKIGKPDTQAGWLTVSKYANEGVPFDVREVVGASKEGRLSVQFGHEQGEPGAYPTGRRLDACWRTKN